MFFEPLFNITTMTFIVILMLHTLQHIGKKHGRKICSLDRNRTPARTERYVRAGVSRAPETPILSPPGWRPSERLPDCVIPVRPSHPGGQAGITRRVQLQQKQQQQPAWFFWYTAAGWQAIVRHKRKCEKPSKNFALKKEKVLTNNYLYPKICRRNLSLQKTSASGKP